MQRHHRISIHALAAATVCSNLACAAVPTSTPTAPPKMPTAKTLSQNVAAQSEIVNLVRIYPRAGFAKRMIGGEIQGSNEDATGGFVTLAKITKAPKEGAWSSISFKNTKRYRFVRYFAPSGSYANVAELQFFNSSTRIKGVPYGTFGSLNNSGNDFNKAFDGDVKTFFDAPIANSQYLGIEIKSATDGQIPDVPVVVGNGLRHYHIGNSLTDGMGEYVHELALAAGYKDDFVDRQTIPGAPLWMNYASDGGFGTNHKVAFDKLAPISDLVMQAFISNGDSDDPEFSLKFYDDARVKSPNIRPWIYGQWIDTGSGSKDSGSPLWEDRNHALMQIYVAHSLNFNALTKGKKSEVIPGGLALSNLKKAVDAGKVPGISNFFSANFNDDLHLSEAGRYFIGLTIYSAIYDKSPVGLPVVKINDNAPKLNEAQAKIYQQIAWDTVQSFKKDGGASLGTKLPAEIDARSFIRGEFPYRSSRVGNIDADRSFLYLLNAPTAGKYDLKVSTMSSNNGSKLNVFVNYKSAGSLDINESKDLPALDSAALPIDLKAGLNMLRLNVPVNRKYDLNSIKIMPVGGALKNAMPIFDLSAGDEDVKPGESWTHTFNVNDLQTPAEKLTVTGSSDNIALVPNANIKIESGAFKESWGNVYNRRISVTPAVGKTGEATVTLTLSDTDGAKRQQSFKIRVK